MRLPTGELVTWQLWRHAARAVCRADREVIVRELVKRFGEEATLVMPTPRLRYRVETCRRSPARVVLRNRYPAQVGAAGFVEVVFYEKSDCS